MNTLTVSIVLLVAATIAGVAIVNLIQGMRSRGARRSADETPAFGTPPARGSARETRYEPILINPERGLAQGQRAALEDLSPTFDVTMPVDAVAPALSGNAVARDAHNIDDVYFASSNTHAADTTAGEPPAGNLMAGSATTPSNTSPAMAPVAYRAAAMALDPRVDCIIEFTLAAPWSGQRLLQLAQANRRMGSKPVLFEALSKPTPAASATLAEPSAAEPSADDASIATGLSSEATAAAARWGILRADQSYRQVRAGVLLANRHGPLNAMEFAEFLALSQRLADLFETVPVLPDMTSTLQQARLLDAECIKLDAQLGINIDCADAIGPADLARVARANALAERGNNRYARLGSGDEVLFSLALSDKPNRVTLLLDVPRAPVDQKPWPVLLSCAHACLAPLQGHVVDDAGRPLNSRNLDSLSAELAQRYAMLDQSGFKAGSALAMRVFN